jgi:hypothetical protein
MSRAVPSHPGSGEVWIEVTHRECALALMNNLQRQHSYLIQLAPERWLVRAHCEADGMLAALISRIDEWRRDHPVAEITIYHSGGDVALSENHPTHSN